MESFQLSLDAQPLQLHLNNDRATADIKPKLVQIYHSILPFFVLKFVYAFINIKNFYTMQTLGATIIVSKETKRVLQFLSFIVK